MKLLIIGGTGSLGKKLIEYYLPSNSVHVISRDEAKHWTMKNELSHTALSNRLTVDNALTFHVGDIRDRRRMFELMTQISPDVVICAAALKHVDTCELSPTESIATNTQGTINALDAFDSLPTGGLAPRTFLFVSTDKACSPINVYGMCKALSERLTTSRSVNGKHRYVCTRYGNVLESRGSIIPLFKYQSENMDAITVTDPEMTRFVMTLDESVQLIDDAIKFCPSGFVLIPKIPAMKIGDLAQIFSEHSGKPIKIINTRPGEKIHEDLMNASEALRSHVTTAPTNRILIAPDHKLKQRDGRGHIITRTLGEEKNEYTSADSVMSKAQLEVHLTKLGILNMTLDKFVGQNIEEIRK